LSEKSPTQENLPRDWFDPGCRRCPRLAAFLDEVRALHPHYHAAPVPPFGPASAPLLIVGLAPGMHGANRTGRPFTGDHAGILLYQALHQLGLASEARALSSDDGLRLAGCRITNAVKCLPPQNKPAPAEVRNCRHWLAAELAGGRPRVVLALGRIAHDAVLDALGAARSRYRFAHGKEHALAGGPWLVDSYHCSRYNTQTRRLTGEMFGAVLARAAELAGAGGR
jgi:uracil-DNA glycosylase